MIDSSGDSIRESVSAHPGIVVATPGAEPFPEQGYAAAVILDAQLSLTRESLRASEQALHRWMSAVALVRPGEEGGSVCIVGPVHDRTVQALVRLDTNWFASQELADRRSAGFPPAVAMLALEAEHDALMSFHDAASWPDDSEVLGPVPLREPKAATDPPLERIMVRAPSSQITELAAAGHAAQALRSARHETGPVRLWMNPDDL